MADKAELKKRGRATIKRVKESGLTQEFIRKEIKISATNFSRFMTEKEGGVTEGMINRINTFLDDHLKKKPKK